MSSRSKGGTLLALALCFLAVATETTQGAPKKSHVVAVTGCLQRGEVADRFHIRGSSGKSYSLRSDRINLADHLGHSVAVKGELKHDPKRDDYDFEGSEVNEEYGKGKIADFVDLEVTSLRMISPSCK